MIAPYDFLRRVERESVGHGFMGRKVIMLLNTESDSRIPETVGNYLETTVGVGLALPTPASLGGTVIGDNLVRL
jgi:hypothetical protein